MFQNLKALADGIGEGGEIFLSRLDAEDLAKAAKRVKNTKLTKKTMRAENGGYMVPCGLLREIVKQCAGLEMDAEEVDPQDNPAPDADDEGDTTTTETTAEGHDAVRDMKVPEAIDVISRMKSIDKLTDIVNNDTRSTVRNAASDRIAALGE